MDETAPFGAAAAGRPRGRIGACLPSVFLTPIPNTVFIRLNGEFGCNSQPNSVQMAMNRESDCVVKPKSGFIATNIEFGCRCGPEGRDITVLVVIRPGLGASPPSRGHLHQTPPRATPRCAATAPDKGAGYRAPPRLNPVLPGCVLALQIGGHPGARPELGSPGGPDPAGQPHPGGVVLRTHLDTQPDASVGAQEIERPYTAPSAICRRLSPANAGNSAQYRRRTSAT